MGARLPRAHLRLCVLVAVFLLAVLQFRALIGLGSNTRGRGGEVVARAAAKDDADAAATHPNPPDGRRWSRRRPPGSSDWPPVTECQAIASHRKFFLYEFEAAGLCKQGAALLRGVQALDHTHRQELGPELFLAQQLADHPRRTRDPAEASLFVVPPLLGLGHSRRTCRVSMERLVREVHRELLASPHYRRHEGRDHLLAIYYYHTRRMVLEGDDATKQRGAALPAIFAEFRHALRHVIIATKNPATFMAHGAMVTVPYNIITVPHLSPSALDACTHRGGRILCPDYSGEASFEEYAARRNYTMFFIGNADRNEVPGAKKTRKKILAQGRLLRPRVVQELGGVHPPNILMRTNTRRVQRLCSFEANVTTDCTTPQLSPKVVAQKMGQSRFALHVQGDDASSSRVFDALATGTPQLFLADRYYADVAPFKCQVPWDRAFRFVDNDEFVRGPAQTMGTLLDQLMDDPGAVEWRGLWEAQRAAADDLLWHTPGSRVGNNFIEDAFRAQDRAHKESAHGPDGANVGANEQDSGGVLEPLAFSAGPGTDKKVTVGAKTLYSVVPVTLVAKPNTAGKSVKTKWKKKTRDGKQKTVTFDQTYTSFQTLDKGKVKCRIHTVPRPNGPPLGALPWLNHTSDARPPSEQYVVHIHGLMHTGTGHLRNVLNAALNATFFDGAPGAHGPVASVQKANRPCWLADQNKAMRCHASQNEGQHLQSVFPSQTVTKELFRQKGQAMKRGVKRTFLAQNGHYASLCTLTNNDADGDNVTHAETARRIGNILFQQWLPFWDRTATFLIQKTPLLEVSFLERVKVLPTFHVIVVRHPWASPSWSQDVGYPHRTLDFNIMWATSFRHVFEELQAGKIEWYAVVTYEALIMYPEAVMEDLMVVVNSGMTSYGGHGRHLGGTDSSGLTPFDTIKSMRRRLELHKDQKDALTYLVPKKESIALWQECLKDDQCHTELEWLTKEVFPFLGYVSVRREESGSPPEVSSLSSVPGTVGVSKSFGRVLFSSEAGALNNARKSELDYKPPQKLISTLKDIFA